MAAVVEALNGVWVPQRDAVIFRRELLPVDVERLIYWHDGRKVEVYLRAQLAGRKRYTDITIIALGVKWLVIDWRRVHPRSR